MEIGTGIGSPLPSSRRRQKGKGQGKVANRLDVLDKGRISTPGGTELGRKRPADPARSQEKRFVSARLPIPRLARDTGGGKETVLEGGDTGGRRRGGLFLQSPPFHQSQRGLHRSPLRAKTPQSQAGAGGFDAVQVGYGVSKKTGTTGKRGRRIVRPVSAGLLH